MRAPTLPELLAQYGALAAIPADALHQAGYERVMKDAESANASSVQVRRIGATPLQPLPRPRIVKNGRRVPNKDWGYRPGWSSSRG